MQQLKGVRGVHINTPLGDEQSCAITNVLVDHRTPAELVDALWDRYRILTVAVEPGARIAPNVFVWLPELDLLARTIRGVAAG